MGTWQRLDAPGRIELTREGSEWVVRQGGSTARFESELLALIWRKCETERQGWLDYEADGEFC